MGKKYDAELVTEYCDAMADAYVAYGQEIDNAQMACTNFADNNSFTGMQADISKEMVGDSEIVVMEDILAVNDKIKTAQADIMELFASYVDAASNARIDEETLDDNNTELKKFHKAFDEIGKHTESIHSQLGRFAKYLSSGEFTKPDFDSGRSASEELCGGNGDGGFIEESKQKLIDFDTEATALLKSHHLEVLINDISGRLHSASAVMSVFAPYSAGRGAYRVTNNPLNKYPRVILLGTGGSDGDDVTDVEDDPYGIVVSIGSLLSSSTAKWYMQYTDDDEVLKRAVDYGMYYLREEEYGFESVMREWEQNGYNPNNEGNALDMAAIAVVLQANWDVVNRSFVQKDAQANADVVANIQRHCLTWKIVEDSTGYYDAEGNEIVCSRTVGFEASQVLVDALIDSVAKDDPSNILPMLSGFKEASYIIPTKDELNIVDAGGADSCASAHAQLDIVIDHAGIVFNITPHMIFAPHESPHLYDDTAKIRETAQLIYYTDMNRSLNYIENIADCTYCTDTLGLGNDQLASILCSAQNSEDMKLLNGLIQVGGTEASYSELFKLCNPEKFGDACGIELSAFSDCLLKSDASGERLLAFTNGMTSSLIDCSKRENYLRMMSDGSYAYACAENLMAMSNTLNQELGFEWESYQAMCRANLLSGYWADIYGIWLDSAIYHHDYNTTIENFDMLTSRNGNMLVNSDGVYTMEYDIGFSYDYSRKKELSEGTVYTDIEYQTGYVVETGHTVDDDSVPHRSIRIMNYSLGTSELASDTQERLIRERAESIEKLPLDIVLDTISTFNPLMGSSASLIVTLCRNKPVLDIAQSTIGVGKVSIKELEIDKQKLDAISNSLGTMGNVLKAVSKYQGIEKQFTSDFKESGMYKMISNGYSYNNATGKVELCDYALMYELSRFNFEGGLEEVYKDAGKIPVPNQIHSRIEDAFFDGVILCTLDEKGKSRKATECRKEIDAAIDLILSGAGNSSYENVFEIPVDIYIAAIDVIDKAIIDYNGVNSTEYALLSKAMEEAVDKRKG